MSRRGHGEGSIYKRPDGRWTAQLSLPGSRRKYIYGKTRREVQEKLTVALRAQQEGLLVTGPAQTVGQYLKRWLEDTVRHSVRPRTYQAYDLNVRRVLPHLGHVRLTALTPALVQACYGALLERGLSRRSVEQAHTVLHGALRQAVQWGLAGRNPTEAVAVPRPGQREMRTLSAEEVRRLFVASANDRLHALWVLLATTGLRLGEATGLRWEDIDFASSRLFVRRAMQRQPGVGMAIVEPKTERSRRTVHLPVGGVTALKEHRRRQVSERLAAGSLWRDQGLVFCNVAGGPLDPSRVNKAFLKTLQRAGLPSIRVNDLRHTAATLLLSQGVHPKVVQELLGHSTIALTLDTYSHVVPALHAEAASKMDGLFESDDQRAEVL